MFPGESVYNEWLLAVHSCLVSVSRSIFLEPRAEVVLKDQGCRAPVLLKEMGPDRELHRIPHEFILFLRVLGQAQECNEKKRKGKKKKEKKTLKEKSKRGPATEDHRHNFTPKKSQKEGND